jgi:hypothetical protein
MTASMVGNEVWTTPSRMGMAASAAKKEVRRRPGERDEREALPGPGSQPPRVDGRRLRPAEAEEEQQRRAHRVEVRERVEGQPPVPPGGVVAELIGGPGVTELVERQPGDNRHKPGCKVDSEDGRVVLERVEIPNHQPNASTPPAYAGSPVRKCAVNPD